MSAIGAKEVCELTGMARRTLQIKTKAGEFPAPTRDGIRVVWDRAAVDGWLEKGKDKLTAPLPAVEPARGEKWSEKGDEATVVRGSVERIRTLEDAIRHAGVDPSVWYVLDWECSSWEVGMKLQARDDKGRVTAEEPYVQPLWRLSMRLRRVMPRPFLAATDALFERLAKASPSHRPPSPRPIGQKRSILLELDLPDAHFGKLAWRKETGQDYDLGIAEKVYQHGFEDLLNVSSGFSPDLIVVPIGNDFYHVDNPKSMTTGGTYVDSDGRYAKIIESGEMAIIRAIDLALTVAPVKVLWVPGNHDRVASYHLARTLKAYYRSTPHVEVDCGPASRKYLRWGTNLIGYVHGDMVKKPSRLVLAMVDECRRDLAAVTCKEWHMGHVHHSDQSETKRVKDDGGFTFRYLQSLSATDAWHFDSGYVGGKAAAECYIMDHDAGYVGHFNVQARTS